MQYTPITNGITLASFQEASRDIAHTLYQQTEGACLLQGYNQEGSWIPNPEKR
jgi:hypothetical protein